MKDLLKIAYNAIDEKQGDDIVCLDFRSVSPFVDYFLICSARNTRLAKAIIENIEDKAIENGFKIKSKNYEDTSNWYLIDLGDVVCHVFTGEDRELYNLEGLWKDLPIVKM